MPTCKSVGIFFLTSILTMLLSATVMFIAPLPARFLRLSYGRTPYWIFTLVSTMAVVPISMAWSLSQFILLLTVGLFTDLEQLKVSTFYSAVSAVFISSVSFLFLLGTWARTQHTDLKTMLNAKISEFLTMTQRVQSAEFPLEAAQVVSLLPALIAISLMLLIFVSAIFIKAGSRQHALTAFKVPEYIIWFFIPALAGTFLVDPVKHFWLQKTLCNGLYILGAAYYFQGLAIVGFYLKRLKLNYFIKVALFFVLTVHLFVFVAAFGLSDVWFSYRSRQYKKMIKDNP
jgi:hypothetical protein